MDERIIFDVEQFEDKEKLGGILWIRLYKYIESILNELKHKNYDLIINLSHSKLSAFMISYLGVTNVHGFGCNGTGDRMTRDPWMQYFGIEQFNRIFNPFNLVEIFTRGTGSAPEDNPMRIRKNCSDNDSISELISLNNIENTDFLVGVQAGSSIKGRRWSPRAFAELADGLVEQHGAKIILFGVKSEKSIADQIKLFSLHRDKIIDLTGSTNVGQLTSFVERCDYLVTNDTGTMHIAAAVGTTIIGLFFAHAHPYETGPYSPGNLIFQARISCAPCSYGVECNDVICVLKVRPDHLLAMIKIHRDEKKWRLADSMTGLEEVNIYNTYMDETRRLRLRPLVRHPISLNDIFREIYSYHWLNTLGTIIKNDLSGYDFEQILLEDYDCSEVHDLSPSICEKISVFKNLKDLSYRGTLITDQIINACTVPISNKLAKLKVYAEKIESLDAEIDRIGFTNPEIKPVTDMFNKRKENFQGNDPIQLAVDTKECYENLSIDAGGTGRYLTLMLERLQSIDNYQAAVGSFNAEVPGK